MTEKKKSRESLRFWQPQWWLPDLKKCDRQDSCKRVSEASAPKPTYYVLIVLSTLIASYGLLSNSTATVIGAMIVAPLMGPILGLALGTIMSDTRMFRKSLIAESTGVVLVILTGLLVALVAGTGHIDFSASEIAGRTRPTLFDLAIGLAAGLAGAYCTVHPGLQSSVAGVAIAVALVPPLAVTGITGAGWLADEVGFRAVFGSFMLFFTNLLTIELASGFVFWGTGFRQSKENSPKEVWRKTLVVKSILLLLTGWFLTIQLANLVKERYGLSTARAELQVLLKKIPGADLDSITAHLNRDVLSVNAVVGSRTDIEPRTVARFEESINEAIRQGMPEMTVELTVRTVNSTFASAEGYLFEPQKVGLDDEERRVQSLDATLRELLEEFPGVELREFHLQSEVGRTATHLNTELVLTLSSPYDFGPRFVRDLEDRLNKAVQVESLFSGYSYKLMVKSILVRGATARDAVAVDAPEMRTAVEKQESEREQKLRELLQTSLELNGDLKVTEIHVRRSHDSSQAPERSSDKKIDSYMVRLEIRSPKLLGENFLAFARKTTAALYEKETGYEVELSLDTVNNVGNSLFLDQSTTADAFDPENPELTEDERLNQELSKLLASFVQKVPGASLDGVTTLQRLGEEPRYRLFCVITSPEPLKGKRLIQWQKALLKSQESIKSLELRLENRLGKTVKLTPTVRK